MPAFIAALRVSLALSLLCVTTSAGTGPKRGVSYTDPSLIINFGGPGSQVNWCFNWDSTAKSVPSYLEWIPMLWGASAGHTTQWSTNADTALVSQKVNSLLAFNEPNNPNQANLTPAYAAAIYNQYMTPFKGRAALGAPAVSSFFDGLNWLSEFLKECSRLGCVVDFVPFHWYGSAKDITGFKSYVEQVRVAGSGRQLWLTEFNAWGSEDEQMTFLRTVMPWLDEQSYIARYCWFGAFPGYLLRPDGLLSPVGSTYTFG